MTRSALGAEGVVPTRFTLFKLFALLLWMLTSGGCADSPAGQVDVKVSVPADFPLQDLVFFVRTGSESSYATGATIRDVESLGGLKGARTVQVSLSTSTPPSGHILVAVVGCSGPARCRCVDDQCDEATRALGPDCECQGQRIIGADSMRASDVRELAVELVDLRPECDADGDLIPDCTQVIDGAPCCAGMRASVQTRVSDCLDDSDNGRRASPFRASEVPASGATTPLLKARHRAWCGDGIDNDCRTPADEPCGDLDEDGVVKGPDCDDDDPAIGPNQAEICGNEVDENCDGLLRCDGDGDGVFDDVDCDDANPERYPGNAEICGDGVDQNCVDGDDACLDAADIDGDGFICPVDHRWQVGLCREGDEGCELRGRGCDGVGEDCDDSNAAVYPGAIEICDDGIDQDCNGEDARCDNDDADSDGVRAASAGGADCDDDDPTVGPGQPEKCGDGVDQDCNGRDLECAPDSDRDGDRWPTPTDCRDGDPNVSPDAAELCNGRDDDCDGRVDEGNPLTMVAGQAPLPRTCGQGCAGGACGCRLGFNICTSVGGMARVECFGVGPNQQPEVCDGVDNDCDGRLDETLMAPCYDGDDEQLGAPQSICRQGTASCAVPRVTITTNCVNAAACGQGQCSAGTCAAVAEYGECMGQVLPSGELCTGSNEDCDASVDEEVFRPCGTDVGLCIQGTQMCTGGGEWANQCVGETTPVDERCDGQDNNCSGQADESFGDLGRPCSAGDGECNRRGEYVCTRDGRGTECNAQAGMPSREICDGQDNDCDDDTDDGSDDDRVGQACDGRDDDLCEEGTLSCRNGELVCSDDSGDNEELCDGEDNDCDGRTDEAFDTLGQQCSVGVGDCEARGVYVCAEDQRSVECAAGPGAPLAEVCDGEDNDCDGTVDEEGADAECVGFTDECRAGQCVCGDRRNPCNQNRADRCVDGQCRCGDGEGCDRNERCVNEECVDD